MSENVVAASDPKRQGCAACHADLVEGPTARGRVVEGIPIGKGESAGGYGGGATVGVGTSKRQGAGAEFAKPEDIVAAIGVSQDIRVVEGPAIGIEAKNGATHEASGSDAECSN